MFAMDEIDKTKEIKAAIEELLKSEKIDYSRFTTLSNALLKQDREHVRFSVDAGIINRLGKELVGRAETAISELIKNAYDAEASYAHLIFKDAVRAGGSFEIEDDGNGMTYDELINGFMRISSSDKIHRPVSPRYKRKKAGKKGIGRFAAQRLGKQLIIITQTETSNQAIKATINWDDYVIDSDINEVTVQIDYVEKERACGTTLIINQLYEGWSDNAILRAYRYTEDLLIPEPLSRERVEWDKGRQDPGFRASFYRDRVSENTIIVDEDTAFYDHALAVIEGYIDAEGQGYWRFSSNKLGVDTTEYKKIGKDRENDSTPYMSARSIHFKTYYFIYDRSLIPGPLFTYVKNLGTEMGGLKLYRNGFRVPPYGEKNNDWLGLDESVRRKTYLFPHQNQSFFGFVEIDDASSDLFEETSSREGLIENEALAEIENFVYRSITTACQEVAALRNRKQTANQKDWEKKSPNQKMQEALTEFSDLINKEKEEQDDSSGSNGQREEQRRKYEQVYEKMREGQEEQEEHTEKLQDKINMLRVLAGLGLAIGEFIHEIKYYFPGFTAEIDELKRLLESNPRALERIDTLESNLMAMKSYTTFFGSTISNNAQRVLEPVSLKEEIGSFEKVIARDCKKADIEITDNRSERNVLMAEMKTIPMHKSEWASIFFNLYTNAKKAIKKSPNSDNGRIRIECYENANNLTLDFSDNGCGVDPAIREHIFEAFVTTTSAAGQGSPDEEAYTGTGLGLSILHDMINSYGGQIFLIETPKDGFVTTFRIEIPKKK